jgi:phenylalanine-4-hydroxylase
MMTLREPDPLRPSASPSQKLLEDTLPILDLDHPGASDPDYRARRLHIASLARAYREQPEGAFPVVEYTEAEHEIWRKLQAVLGQLHAEHACCAYGEGRARLALPTTYIPQLGEVSARLGAVTGFRLWPVEGLVLPRLFLQHLERGIMLSTQYIRHPSRPFFTPEPDIVHELLGHAPMLAHRPLAELSRLVGKGARLASEAELAQLGRLYWFTVEFGLIEEQGGVKAFGAGLLGGVEDLRRAFSAEADVRPFDLEQVLGLEYDYNHPQPVYFVIPSFERLCADVGAFVARLEAG